MKEPLIPPLLLSLDVHKPRLGSNVVRDKKDLRRIGIFPGSLMDNLQNLILKTRREEHFHGLLVILIVSSLLPLMKVDQQVQPDLSLIHI